MLQNKSKKSGPLKAWSSVFASDEKISDSGLSDGPSPRKTSPPPPTSAAPPKQSSPLSSKKKGTAAYSSKDDLSLGVQGEQKKKKGKVKANPYATIKMWRPITMTSSVSHEEDAYRNFTNFDVLLGEARLPATGDLRNEDYHPSQGPPASHSAPALAADFAVDGASIAPDYHGSPSSDRSAQPLSPERSERRVDFRSGFPSGQPPSVYRTESQSKPSSAVTIPLKSRTISVADGQRQEQQESAMLVAPPRRSRQESRSSTSVTAASSTNGGTDIPADYSLQSSPSSSSGGGQRVRSLSHDSRERRGSPERRGRTIMDSSYDVVSADACKAVRAVLSKTYGPEGFEVAAQDVETLLARLKVTMETLRPAQQSVASSGSQFQTARQELQLQTKQFVQDAKALVAGATRAREAVSQHLHEAMHTLARLFLHGQATMVRMSSVHQAQHVGFEVLKVSASFKSTVIAANAALGRPTTDPHMKYLMRQATNLAGLLSTLLKTLKTLQQS